MCKRIKFYFKIFISKFFIVSFFLITSCKAPNTNPENILSKQKMAEIIADLAIYNQSHLINNSVNTEEIALFVIKKHKITIKDFKENYEYYTYAPSQLDEIYTMAKKILLKKDLKLENYINKKENEKTK